MPINIPNDLPARQTLEDENIFVMNQSRAGTQEIRPLQILLLNLMPTKIETETQLCRLLSNTPLQVELELMQTASHKAANVSEEHMLRFYSIFDDVKDRYFDGMIITGAPVENMDFEEVEYWDELCKIMDWSKSHVHSVLHICWGAQAGLYHHYGIEKRPLPAKMFGVFPHQVSRKSSILFRGFDETFMVPHSRHTESDHDQIRAEKHLKILAESPEAGIYAMSTEGGRQIFITGHSEYDADTLEKEYRRDKAKGIDIAVPKNYYPEDDDTRAPMLTWRSSAHMLFANWLNYFVYQTTPYQVNAIQPFHRYPEKESKTRE